MSMKIIKLNPDIFESDGAAIHLDEYKVGEFTGTYTQCLIYVGAITLGKSHDVARKFAYGIYR